MAKEDLSRVSSLQGFRGTFAHIVGPAIGGLLIASRAAFTFWMDVDEDLWRHYWFGMINRGVMASPTGGMSSGRSRFSTPKRISISIWLPSTILPLILRKHSRSVRALW